MRGIRTLAPSVGLHPSSSASPRARPGKPLPISSRPNLPVLKSNADSPGISFHSSQLRKLQTGGAAHHPPPPPSPPSLLRLSFRLPCPPSPARRPSRAPSSPSAATPTRPPTGPWLLATPRGPSHPNHPPPIRSREATSHGFLLVSGALSSSVHSTVRARARRLFPETRPLRLAQPRAFPCV